MSPLLDVVLSMGEAVLIERSPALAATLLEEGVEGKNAATYALAARKCQDEPGEHLSRILNFCSAAA